MMTVSCYLGTTRWPVYEHEASIHDQTPEAMEHLPHEAVLLVRLLVAHRLGILLNTC
jgi:hypothetical protein